MSSNEIQSYIEEQQKTANDSRDEASKSLGELKKQLQDAQDEASKNLGELKKQLQDAQNNLNKFTAQLNELKTKADAFDRLNREKLAMNGAVVKSRYDGEQEVKESSQANASLAEWLDANLTDQQRASMTTALKDIDKHITDLQKELDDAVTSQTTAEKALADKLKAASDAEKQYKDKVAKLLGYPKQLDIARNLVEKQRAALKAAVDSQNASDVFFVIKELDRKQTNLQNLINEVTDEKLNQLSDEINKLWEDFNFPSDLQSLKVDVDKKRANSAERKNQLNSVQQTRDDDVKAKFAEVLAASH